MPRHWKSNALTTLHGAERRVQKDHLNAQDSAAGSGLPVALPHIHSPDPAPEPINYSSSQPHVTAVTNEIMRFRDLDLPICHVICSLKLVLWDLTAFRFVFKLQIGRESPANPPLNNGVRASPSKKLQVGLCCNLLTAASTRTPSSIG